MESGHGNVQRLREAQIGCALGVTGSDWFQDRLQPKPVLFFPAFLGPVRPSHAVFTVGYRNRFGHPKQEVVARYLRAGAAIWRTDRDGAVTVRLEAGGATVSRYRDESRRYWR